MRRTSARVSANGAIGAQTATPPWRVTSLATHPIRSTLRSRSARLKPRPDDSSRRAASPSTNVTDLPRSTRASTSPRASVDFPDPDKPVKNTVKPRSVRGGRQRRRTAATSAATISSKAPGAASRARAIRVHPAASGATSESTRVASAARTNSSAPAGVTVSTPGTSGNGTSNGGPAGVASRGNEARTARTRTSGGSPDWPVPATHGSRRSRAPWPAAASAKRRSSSAVKGRPSTTATAGTPASSRRTSSGHLRSARNGPTRNGRSAPTVPATTALSPL